MQIFMDDLFIPFINFYFIYPNKIYNICLENIEINNKYHVILNID